MAKLLSQEELDSLLASVEDMTPEELEEQAKRVATQQAERKQKQEEYHKNLDPTKVAAQREKQKKNGQLKRAREKAILAKAKELGLSLD